jgi:excisionase family DNA binding protein
MKKIDFLAPPEDTGGSNDSNRKKNQFTKPDPNLQLLKEIFPGRATITVKETGTVLGVSDDFIYERLKTGEIKGISTGRNWAIPLTEVARLLKEGVE